MTEKNKDDFLMGLEKVYENKEEFRKGLILELKKLAQNGQWSVYTHQINGARDELFDSHPMRKLKGVFKCGLACSRYGSISGTTVFAGTVRPEGDKRTFPDLSSISDDEREAVEKEYDFESVVDRLLNYDYHDFTSTGGNTFPTLVLAFPKVIEVDGKEVEFSTSKYCSYRPNGWDNLTALAKANPSKDLYRDSQHMPVSWKDISKDIVKTEDGFEFRTFRDFNPHDTLLAFYKDENGEYHLFSPNTHWTNEANKEELKQYLKDMADFISYCKFDLDSSIINKWSENSEIVYQRLDENMFD